MRHIDLGMVPRQDSQAVYHAVAHEMRPGDPPTLITVTPDGPYVCVGYHQHGSRDVDRAFCEAHDILVGRRLVGGGAVLLDPGQVFWHLVMPRTAEPIERLYARLLRAPVRAYQDMGIAAEHRPVNDIVVGRRKIGGTGAVTLDQATVLVGSLMFDFDVALMARVLRVPSEKFRDKMVASLEEYMTTMRRELGADIPSRAAATALLVRAFSEQLGETVERGRLADAEREEVRRYASLLFDPAFVYQYEGFSEPGVKIRDGVRLHEGLYKAPGGLIRVIFRVADGRFDDVAVTGDFFVDPPDALSAVAAALVGTSAAAEESLKVLSRALIGVRIPGVTARDINCALEDGLARTPQAAPRA